MACGQRHHHEAHAVGGGEVPAVLSVDRIAEAGSLRAVDKRLGEEPEVGRGRQGDIVQWQPDGAAVAGGIPVPQRGQHRQCGVQPAADVPGRHDVVDRSVMTDRTGDQGEAGGRVDGVVDTGRPVGPAEYFEMNQIRALRTQRRMGMPLSPSDIGDQHATVDDQLLNEPLALLAAHVDGHRALALIESGPVDAVAGVGQGPPVIVRGAADRIDADHLGAERGKCHPGQRHRDEAGDLDDPDTGQRQPGGKFGGWLTHQMSMAVTPEAAGSSRWPGWRGAPPRPATARRSPPVAPSRGHG